MLATPFLIAVFIVAFRRFARQSVWVTAAGIPCVIIAGLTATNLFEPAAQAFARSAGPFAFLGSEADFVLFIAIFVGSLAALSKLITAFSRLPSLPKSFEIPANLLLSVAASYLVMSITLTACDTSPRLQSMLGLQPDSAALLGFVAPDAHWLNLVEVVADGSLSRSKHAISQSDDQLDQAQRLIVGNQMRTLRQRYFAASK